MTVHSDRPVQIELRGVRVHNLKNIDLDIPLGRLIVVTGVSGSGKSSLAFDTLYVEGQRRYVESFSTYSRRFLERFEKPDADRIEPIPPAVAVRQTPGGRSRRATVGTATEIYDYLRLLFARVGSIECLACGRRVERHTPASAQAVLAALEPGMRFMICFPIVDSHRTEAGFTRVIVGGRTVAAAEAAPLLSPQTESFAVVDRLTAGSTSSERLADSLELAFRYGDGSCVALVQNGTIDGGHSATGGDADSARDRRKVDGVDYRIFAFNTRLICAGCGREFADPQSALFNFNSPLGACSRCHGTGDVVVETAEGRSLQVCPECLGARLQPDALAVRVAGETIVELTRSTVAELVAFFTALRGRLSADERKLSEQILTQVASRLEYLAQVGLGYLTLDRAARSLSGGEARRVRLAAAFGSRFVDLLYVLDEPTTGLHPRDTEPLLAAIIRLRDAGNTVVVVEHDSALIRRADQVVDLGPGAGSEGGRIMFQGPPDELVRSSQTATAEFLSERRQVAGAQPAARRAPSGWLHLTGVEHHNLHDLTVDFPLGVLCVVTGVSGSGKSSLVEDSLYPAVVAGLRGRAPSDAGESQKNGHPRRHLSNLSLEMGRYSSLSGLEQIDTAQLIDHSPIGRSARANPVSFLNLFGEIRRLFADTAEAKVRNFPAGHFSFNAAAGGRCETCRGTGSIAVDMQFLPDVVTTCPDCHGSRYRRETLEVRYRGLSIAEVLALTVRDAFSFFRGQTRLQRRMKVLKDVGLDYITLGQPADTLSGGESQRLKLASFLSRASRLRTLFVVDEPTTGLHPADVARLLDCLELILAGGHSLIVIEHNLDFIRCADFLIDLGPEAGALGGRVVAVGTPEEVARIPESITGQYLARGTSQISAADEQR